MAKEKRLITKLQDSAKEIIDSEYTQSFIDLFRESFSPYDHANGPSRDVNASRNFWNTLSSRFKEPLTEEEKKVLYTDASAPYVFLGQMMHQTGTPKTTSALQSLYREVSRA